MKKITVAIDSFKGSLTTYQSGEAVKEGIKAVYPDAEVIISPVADGGEGTKDAITFANKGELIKIEVSDPLGRRIEASYGILPEKNEAVIEMSSAAGITLVSDSERNPMNTTTYGVGEMIRDAISRGCRKFIIGIGGSATNDGGVGMLQALGFEFLNSSGSDIPLGAKGLEDLKEIKTEKKIPELSECKFLVACDVKNVLTGKNGASAVFGPQKGATEEMVRDMDLWLENYADLTEKILPDSDKNFPGTGAAGGMGFALLAYLGAELQSGVDIVINETGVEKHIKESDLVITGEGRLDGQTYMGKAPIGIAKISKKYDKPTIAFSGCVTEDAGLCNDYGIDAFFPILRKPVTLSEAMDIDNAYENLKNTTIQALRLIKTFKK